MEHLRPIAGFGAAGAGGDDQETRRNVARLIEQGEQFVGADVLFEALGIGEGLAGEVGIVEFLGQGDAFVDVRHAGFEFQEGLEFFLQSGGGGADRLGLVGVIPELGGAHGLLEGVDFMFEGWDVKGTS